jgi:hypothetical protein
MQFKVKQLNLLKACQLLTFANLFTWRMICSNTNNLSSKCLMRNWYRFFNNYNSGKSQGIVKTT